MLTSKKLIINFETESGETSKIQVNNVKDNLTLQEVQEVASSIVTQNVFFTNYGDLTELKNAEVITTIREELV